MLVINVSECVVHLLLLQMKNKTSECVIEGVCGRLLADEFVWFIKECVNQCFAKVLMKWSPGFEGGIKMEDIILSV